MLQDPPGGWTCRYRSPELEVGLGLMSTIGRRDRSLRACRHVVRDLAVEAVDEASQPQGARCQCRHHVA